MVTRFIQIFLICFLCGINEVLANEVLVLENFASIVQPGCYVHVIKPKSENIRNSQIPISTSEKSHSVTGTVSGIQVNKMLYNSKGVICLRIILTNSHEESEFNFFNKYLIENWQLTATDSPGIRNTAYPSATMGIIVTKTCQIEFRRTGIVLPAPFLGNEPEGRWAKNLNFPTAEELLDIVLVITNYKGRFCFSTILRKINKMTQLENIYTESAFQVSFKNGLMTPLIRSDFSLTVELWNLQGFATNRMLQASVKFISHGFNKTILKSWPLARNQVPNLRGFPLVKMVTLSEMAEFANYDSWDVSGHVSYSRSAAITCARQESSYFKTTFWDYLQPFDNWVWLSLLVKLVGLCLILKIMFNVPYKRTIFDMVSIFLEQAIIFRKQFRLSILQFTLIIMGIIIANGYKGIVTTSLVVKLHLPPFESIEDAIGAKIKVIDRVTSNAQSLYDESCMNDSSLNSWIGETHEDFEKLELFRAGQPRDVLFSVTMTALRLFWGPIGRLDEFVNEIRMKSTLTSLDPNRLTLGVDKMAIKVIRNFKLLPCGSTILKELAKCSTIHVNDAKIFESYLQYLQSQASSRQKGYYVIKLDKSDMFRPLVTYLTLSMSPLLNSTVGRSFKVFFESGFNIFYMKYGAELPQMPDIPGNITHQPRFSPLTLASRMSTSFVIYGICTVSSVLVLLAELSQLHICGGIVEI